MKTLNEQIERLRELIRKCYGVVASKNGIVPEVGERNMENLPNAIASTHDTLEELTITQNGEYLPSDGMDGFSKVTAEFDTSSLPKVKLSKLQVTNDCINEDGIWEGATLLDTTEMKNNDYVFSGCTKLKYIDVSNWRWGEGTRISNFFSNCSALQNIDVSNWNIENVIALRFVFNSCKSLKSLDVSKWDTRNVSDFYAFVYDCGSLEYLDVSNWDVSKSTIMTNMFSNCTSLQSLDVSKWDVSNVTDFSNIFSNCALFTMLDLTQWDVCNATRLLNMFSYCRKLSSIVGGISIDEIINKSISALKNAKVSFAFTNGPIFDRASLRAVINGLADLTGQTAQTLTLGATLLAKLTEEDIAIATNKNWTIV